MASLAVQWLLLVELIMLTDSCGVMPLARRRRVINGDTIHPHQYPWMASIHTNRTHYCSGVLLSASYVLTAGHCFIKDSSIASRAEVALGLHHWHEDGHVINGSVLIHPFFVTQRLDYTGFSAEFDVALVRLDTPAPLGARVQPICLPDIDESVTFGDEVRMVGWGQKFTKAELIKYLYEQNGNRTVSQQELLEAVRKLLDLTMTSPGTSEVHRRMHSKEPHELKLWLEDPDVCYDHFASYMTSVSEACNTGGIDALWCSSTGIAADDGVNYTVKDFGFMLCANRHDEFGKRRSPCYGDSGGPLMKRRADGVWVLLGVTAFGETDCVTNLAGFHEVGTFFANVLLMLPWIQFTLNGYVINSAAIASTAQPLWLLSFLLVIAFSK